MEPIGEAFGLSWEIRQLEPPLHIAAVPCVEAEEMSCFERTLHGEAVPRGSLVDAATAGVLVRAFLETPDQLPDNLAWCSRFDITWPDES